jgi:cell division protein FtsA
MAAPREQLYSAIDVGTTKVATLVARVGATGAIEVVAIGRASSEGMKKGMVADAAELARSVRTSVRYAEEMLGRPIPPAFVGITGAFLSCENVISEIPETGMDVISESDVNKLIQNTVQERSFDRPVLHVIPRSYQVANARNVRNPIGLRGGRLAAQTHVVYGAKEPIAALAKVVQDAGVQVRGLIIEQIASAEAVLTASERDMGVVLVDIGGGTSDIAVYKDGALLYSAVIPVAGTQFTTDLVIGLGVTQPAAEATKLHFGSCITDGINEKESVNVDTGMAGHIRPVSRYHINKLLHDRAVELTRLVLIKLQEGGFDRIPAGGIVLTAHRGQRQPARPA